MKRREFITLLGGAAAAWPLAARAQQRERMRRIGVLMPGTADDPECQARIAAFLQGLQQLGWTIGRNVRIDYRWGCGRCRPHSQIRGGIGRARAGRHSWPMAPRPWGALLQATRTVPIVFVDRPRSGRRRLRRRAWRGRAATPPGFITFEYGMSGKWLELLKEIAPGVTRVAVLRDPAITAGIGQFGAIQSVAPSLGVELRPVNVRDAGEIERAVAAFARAPNGGLIVTASALAALHRDLIITLAARHKLARGLLPTARLSPAGGLISYGPDCIDQFRRAAGYVDRILKGEKPADLPVQAPTKYELVINLKTAKALGLDVPPTLLARADEVIE